MKQRCGATSLYCECVGVFVSGEPVMDVDVDVDPTTYVLGHQKQKWAIFVLVLGLALARCSGPQALKSPIKTVNRGFISTQST